MTAIPIVVNYSYFLLYGSSRPQSQRNFLTLLIYSTALRTYLLQLHGALPWGRTFFSRMEHCAEDIPFSAAWSTVLRTYLLQLHGVLCWGHAFLQRMNTSGPDQRPVITICVCAILRHANTIAKLATSTTWSRATSCDWIMLVHEGKQNGWQCTSKLWCKFCSSVKRLFYAKPHVLIQSFAALRRSSWSIRYCMEKLNCTHVHPAMEERAPDSVTPQACYSRGSSPRGVLDLDEILYLYKIN